jgi:hypothetical protein
VLLGLQDGPRHDAVDPVLDAAPAVGEGQPAVVDEVDRATGAQQVFDERAAAAQVVGEVGGAERRDEQQRGLVEGFDPVERPVAVEHRPALARRVGRPHRDPVAGHAPQVGDPARQRVPHVGRRGEQIHAETLSGRRAHGGVPHRHLAPLPSCARCRSVPR